MGWMVSRAMIAVAAVGGTLGTWGLGDGAHAKEPSRPLSALSVATRDPCRLLAAIMGGEQTQPAPAAQPWKVHLSAESCETNVIQRRPVLMSLFEAGGRETKLIDWGRSCGAGPGGPTVQPGAKVEIYNIGLYVKDDATLTFDVDEQYFVFDHKGKETTNVIAGCSSFTGQAAVEVAERPRYLR